MKERDYMLVIFVVHEGERPHVGDICGTRVSKYFQECLVLITNCNFVLEANILRKRLITFPYGGGND